MDRLALVTEYDGTDFVGFQIQDNGRSVQGVLNEALSKLYKEEIKVTGCSRTDSGVHAKGHVSSADVPFYIPEEKIPLALNAFLPGDLSCRRAIRVKEGFNARYDNLGKRYIYRIYSSPVRSPLLSRYSAYTSYRPDIGRMNEAAALFSGEHDFGSFCAAGSSAKTTVRKLDHVLVREREDIRGLLEIEVVGEAFLYNMVRIIAGTLLYVGTGKMSCDEVRISLEEPDRSNAGKTMPPQGLTLEEVFYDWDKWRI